MAHTYAVNVTRKEDGAVHPTLVINYETPKSQKQVIEDACDLLSAMWPEETSPEQVAQFYSLSVTDAEAPVWL